MAVVFISEGANSKFLKELEDCGHNVVKIQKHDKLYTAIETHPDIVLCQIDNKIFIEEKTYYDLINRYPKLQNSIDDFDFIITSKIKNGKYPSNIGLNLAYTGRYAIHNFKHTDKALLDFLSEQDIEMIAVSQGYSKCSILIVNETSIITSDKGIYDNVREKIDCLLISQGEILLKGMEYGFIGGASGKHKDEIWFYGDIYSHPDYDRIYNFINSKGLKIKGFSEFKLEDVGTVVFVDM